MMLEIKHYLRKRKLWIALVSVILCSGLLSFELGDNAQIESKENFIKNIAFMNLAYQAMDAQTEENIQTIEFDDKGFMYYPDFENEFNTTLGEKTEKLSMAIQENDQKKVNSLTCDIALMQADRMLYITEDDNYGLYNRNYFNHYEVIQKLIEKRGLPRYERANHDDVIYNFYGTNGMDQVQLFPLFQFSARFYDQLEKQNIDKLTYSQVDSGTLVIQFTRSLFPFIPIILISLLFFDSISEDRDSGVLKTILSQAKARSVYLNKKILANCISAVLIFIVPFLVLSLTLGLFDQFKTMQAPTLANVEGVTSFVMLENPMADPIGGEIVHESIGISDYMALPGPSGSPNGNLDFIPMWQFSLLCIVLSIFIILFCVMLNTFLNVICKNKLMSLILSIGIVMLGIGFVSANNYALWYAFLPFTFMNPVHILSGFYTYSYLNGIVVLSIYSIILYGLSIFFFKRKDIA